MISARPITIVTPVYNDWISFGHLLRDLDHVATATDQPLRIIAVDDGSTQPSEQHIPDSVSPNILSVESVQLIRNMGHQRAICIGLVQAHAYSDYDAIIVMDADGEDTPESISKLIEAHRVHENNIVVAVRGRRYTSFTFKAFYILYKLLFRLMVGKNINFGNFCLIPKSLLERLTYDPNLWNHLAATIVRAGVPVHYVNIDRGTRYDGSSKMNFQSLVMHGLSAISVFIDVVFLRFMLLSVTLAFLLFVGILVVIGILLFTRLAIPGWATSAVGILSIILFQILILSASAVFFLLSQRSGNIFIPALDTSRLIKEHKVMVAND